MFNTIEGTVPSTFKRKVSVRVKNIIWKDVDSGNFEVIDVDDSPLVVKMPDMVLDFSNSAFTDVMKNKTRRRSRAS